MNLQSLWLQRHKPGKYLSKIEHVRFYPVTKSNKSPHLPTSGISWYSYILVVLPGFPGSCFLEEATSTGLDFHSWWNCKRRALLLRRSKQGAGTYKACVLQCTYYHSWLGRWSCVLYMQIIHTSIFLLVSVNASWWMGGLFWCDVRVVLCTLSQSGSPLCSFSNTEGEVLQLQTLPPTLLCTKICNFFLFFISAEFY